GRVAAGRARRRTVTALRAGGPPSSRRATAPARWPGSCACLPRARRRVRGPSRRARAGRVGSPPRARSVHYRPRPHVSCRDDRTCRLRWRIMRAANPGRRRAALRAASIALGLLFVVRPLTGVDVLLVVTIAALALGGAHRAVASRRARERVAGALLVTVAGVLALEPVWGVRALVATAATASAAAGAFLLTRRGWAPRATGVGSALLGVAAVLWPDVAQIVIPV